MNILNLDSSKVITDKANSFFKNNRFMIGTEIPTEGSYNLGDIVINTGETALTEPMWICTESGNPGTWQVFSGGGAGGGRTVCLRNQVIIDSAANTIDIGIGTFSKATDTLMVFINADYAYENVDYKVEGTKIVAVDKDWNKVGMRDFTFDFIVFKSILDEGLSSSTELVYLKNHIILEEDMSEINMGIENYCKDTDILNVYKNSAYLIDGVDYTTESSTIKNLKGTWNQGDVFAFTVIKQVAKLIPAATVYSDNIVDGSVTSGKLSSDVRQMIQDAGNIDLSNYAKKEDLISSNIIIDPTNNITLDYHLYEIYTWAQDAQLSIDFCVTALGDGNQLLTQNKDTVVGAINELFQNVSNGKSLIATAITDKGIETSSDDTFEVMANNINSITGIFLPDWASGDEWITAKAMDVYACDSASCVINKNIYCLGGHYDATDSNGPTGDIKLSAFCDYYKAGNNTVSFIGSMPTYRCFLAADSAGDYIYTIGGYNDSTYVNAVERTNGVTVNHSWETMNSMPTARGYLVSGEVNGKIHCIYGRNGSSGYLGTHEVYDTASNTWSSLTSASDTRRGLTATTIGSKIYCIGGYTGSLSKLNKVYDTASQTWTELANMITGRQYTGSAELNGKIYVIGGQNTNALSGTSNLNECYDPMTNTWSSKKSLPQAISTPVVENAGGFIYVLCGKTKDSKHLNTNYCYITK